MTTHLRAKPAATAEPEVDAREPVVRLMPVLRSAPEVLSSRPSKSRRTWPLAILRRLVHPLALLPGDQGWCAVVPADGERVLL